MAFCSFSSHRNDDCSRTTYSSSYPALREPLVLPSKIDSVCRALEEVMGRVDRDKFICPILSCLVKRDAGGEGAAKALLKINEIRATNPKLADEAVQFLLLLVDVDKLFNVALGTYDFQLVLYVAAMSQKVRCYTTLETISCFWSSLFFKQDPKEFLPYLNELRRLPAPLRQFRVDVKLRRLPRALRHLGGGFESQIDEAVRNEVADVVAKNRMYAEALDVFDKQGELFKVNACYLSLSSLFVLL